MSVQQYAYIILLLILLIIIFGGIIWVSIYLFREFRQIISWYGIPFVRTPDHKLQKLIEHIELWVWQTFLDIWCGDGLILQYMSQKYPKNRIIGYENSTLPYELALKRKKEYHCNYTVLNEDFFSAHIANIDIIYSYMMPHLMEKIWRKIEKECKPGTLLYSNSFPIAGVPLYRIMKFERDQNIYIYVVK